MITRWFTGFLCGIAVACSSEAPDFADATDESDEGASAVDAGEGADDAAEQDSESRSDTDDDGLASADDDSTPGDSSDRDSGATDDDSEAEPDDDESDVAPGSDAGADSDGDPSGRDEADESTAMDDGKPDEQEPTDAGSEMSGGSDDSESSDDAVGTDDPIDPEMNDEPDAGSEPDEPDCLSEADCEAPLLCSPQGACVECLAGAESRPSESACGLNGSGVLEESCIDGFWIEGDSCLDTDVCTNGESSEGTTPCGLNDNGALELVCVDGHWEDSANCIDPDECTDGSEQAGSTACGLNGNGLIPEQCVAGSWTELDACDDPDACINGTTTTCGAEYGSLGVCTAREITCTNGSFDAVACEGGQELCNADGLDEDCDGEVNEVPPCDRYTELSTGGSNACAVTEQSLLYCWGDNNFGEAASAALGVQSTPTVVAGVSNVRHVNAGDYATCATFEDDTAICWGSNSNYQLGDGTNDTPPLGTSVDVSLVSNIQEMAPGFNGSCAWLTNGQVQCWGAAPNETQTRTIGGLGTILDIDVSPYGDHFCALIDDGSVACWFHADDTATTISGVANATQIGVGDAQSCARTSTGSVVCWETTLALTQNNLPSSVAVDSGSNLSCAVTNQGDVYCWGEVYGATPTKINGVANANSVAVGYSYACATLEDDSVSCFGRNLDGTLGNPDTPCCSLDVIDTLFPPVPLYGP